MILSNLLELIKITTSTLKLTISVLLLMFYTLQMTAQSIITFDNNPYSLTTYQTLQDSHDNAMLDDTIYVQLSDISYDRSVLFKPITVTGISHK